MWRLGGRGRKLDRSRSGGRDCGGWGRPDRLGLNLNPRCVTSGKLPNFSEPQLPCLSERGHGRATLGIAVVRRGEQTDVHTLLVPVCSFRRLLCDAARTLQTRTLWGWGAQPPFSQLGGGEGGALSIWDGWSGWVVLCSQGCALVRGWCVCMWGGAELRLGTEESEFFLGDRGRIPARGLLASCLAPTPALLSGVAYWAGLRAGPARHPAG